MLRGVYLPQLGQTMEEGTIEKWHKREGESLRKGEVLYELTTDKATLEVESFADGVLKKVLAGEGQTVPVNQLIAVIGDEQDELPGDLTELGGAPADAAAGPPEPAGVGPAAAQPPAAGQPPSAEAFASPRARKVAREKKVPLQALRGSGPGGRVVERDVARYLAALSQVPHTPAAAAEAYEAGVNLVQVAAGLTGRRVRKADVERAAGLVAGRPGGAAGERVPLSPMRRTIAQRMTQAKQTAPHFYLAGEVHMRAALEFLERAAVESAERAALESAERAGSAAGKATVTALLVKAVATALKQHPRLNARFDGDAVLLNAECNVGVAVAVEDGLFVPVIKRADAKGLDEISWELRSLAETARAGKLIPEQYEGGSITISNLGMYGVDSFLPILNPPESCIIGVGAIADRVVVRDGGMAIEPVMEVSLSADHRVVNGVEAARFFQTLKALLEAPDALGA